MHPIVLYYRKENEFDLVPRSICFISDDLKHDVNFEYKVMKDTIKYIFDNITEALSGQYKNCKFFLNLCLHNSDFGVKCEWNFFATSHAKSPCDGIGGSVKRLVTRACLQRPISNQILTAHKMFEFCVDEIKGIDFLFLKNQEIGNIRVNMEERYKRADTVPGTRSFHQFIPISDSIIGAKYVSDDQYHAVQFVFNIVHLLGPGDTLSPSQFVVCLYDRHYWVGIIIEVSTENVDVKVKFMHPKLQHHH